MKFTYLIAYISFLVIIVFIACSKNKFETNPHIEIKSVSSKDIPVGGTMNIRLQFTDKQGDLDGNVLIYKKRLNKRVTTTIRDSINLKIPTFPYTSKGEIELNLAYQDHLISALNVLRNPLTGKNEPDTIRMKLVVKDKAGNKSDTAVIDNVIVTR